MNINWSTLILEVINFLVLIWILKRFLYRPVLAAVERRRKSIQDSLAEAMATRRAAEDLKERYEEKILEWDREKEARLSSLAGEIETERERLMEELRTRIEEERRSREDEEARRLAAQAQENERRALGQGGRFVSRLLKRLAGPELEERQLSLFVEELENLPPERLDALRSSAEDGEEIWVESAFPLHSAGEQRLAEALERTLASHHTVQFKLNPDLIAGLRVQIGCWVLDANLGSELEFFSEAGRNEP